MESTLRQLWREGVPAKSIAAQLGHDLSKNAVVGKAHRLQLPRRRNPATKVFR